MQRADDPLERPGTEKTIHGFAIAVWFSKLDTRENPQLGERMATSVQTLEVPRYVKSWRMKNPTDRIIRIRTLDDELFEIRVVAKISG